MLTLSFFLLWILSCNSNYDTYKFIPYAPSFNSLTAFFISQDLNHFITTESAYSGLSYFTANQNVFTYMYQITPSDINLIGTTRNLSMIYSYSKIENKLRIFSRSDTTISLIQQITPSATTSTTAQFSTDGSRFTIGFTNVIIAYVYNGAQYVLDSNTTVPVTYAPNSVRSISPDGKFMMYGQVIANGHLRILWMNAGSGFTEIPWAYGFAGTTSYFSDITISNPTLGIYDIVFRRSSSGGLTSIYMTFDSNTNTVNVQQALMNMSNSGNANSPSLISSNGKYLMIADRPTCLMVLYQKQVSNKFVSIYNYSILVTGYWYTPNFVSNDGKLAIFIQGIDLNFIFACEVTNCYKCSWTDICQICDSGFTLVGNSCHQSSTNSKADKTTQAIMISLLVIVCVMAGVLGITIYKLTKINSSPANVSGELIQKSAQIDKTKSVTDVRNNQSRDQLSLNQNANEESHQTLAQSRNYQSLATSIQNNPQLENFGLTLNDSNIIQVRARKKKRNIDFKEHIDDNLQEISIQNSIRKETQKQ